jgi:hypothetical protein
MCYLGESLQKQNDKKSAVVGTSEVNSGSCEDSCDRESCGGESILECLGEVR